MNQLQLPRDLAKYLFCFIFSWWSLLANSKRVQLFTITALAWIFKKLLYYRSVFDSFNQAEDDSCVHELRQTKRLPFYTSSDFLKLEKIAQTTCEWRWFIIENFLKHMPEMFKCLFFSSLLTLYFSSNPSNFSVESRFSLAISFILVAALLFDFFLLIFILLQKFSSFFIFHFLYLSGSRSGVGISIWNNFDVYGVWKTETRWYKVRWYESFLSCDHLLFIVFPFLCHISICLKTHSLLLKSCIDFTKIGDD